MDLKDTVMWLCFLPLSLMKTSHKYFDFDSSRVQNGGLWESTSELDYLGEWSFIQNLLTHSKISTLKYYVALDIFISEVVLYFI